MPALRGDAVALRHCPADAAAFEIPYCGVCHLYGALRQRAVLFLSAIIKLQRVTEVPGELHQMPLRPAPGTEALERSVFQIDRKRVLVVSAALAVRAPAEKKLLAAHGLPYHPDIEAFTADQILPMVEADLGIGFVPEEFLEKWSKVCRIDLQEKIPERNVVVIKRKGQPLSVAAKELEKMILAAEK